MAARYNAFIAKIRDWANRDDAVLTDERIGDFMRYALDKAYRGLRIPVFERTFSLTMDETTHADLITNNRIPVPVDLTEFIHIRLKNAFGTGNSIVLNEKADTRTFHDYYAEKYDVEYTWTRQGRYIYLPRNPGVTAGQEWEIFYYGRLPQLGTAYDVTEGNLALDALHEATQSEIDDVGIVTETLADGLTYAGNEVNNWFIMENERVLLFGALAEAFAYLGEDDMQQKYQQMFSNEITELNLEEGQRHASGGNVRMNFDGRGLI